MRALLCLVLLASCSKLLDIDHIDYTANDTPDAAPDAPPTAAKLQAGAPAYDFGAITLGHSSFAIAIDISNIGNAATGTLALAQSDDAGDFTVGSDACSGHSLAAGADCKVMIAFSPSDAGAKTSTLTIADGATSAATTLNGSALTAGALDISPSIVDFGRSGVGLATNPVAITLTNTGDTPISVTSLALSNATFAYDASSCALPKTLAAHATCTASVTFTPPLGGSHVASLTATTDAASNNMTSVSLGGTGTSTITITKSGGTGVVTSGDSAITCPSTCTATFETPTVTFTVAPDTYNEFGTWSANCKPADAPTCAVQTNADQIGVAASLVPWPTLSLNVTGASGSVSGWGGNCQNGNTCVSRQPPGSTITLTPGGPNTFNLWTGRDCTNAAYPGCTFVINSDSTESADFTNDYAIDIVDQSTGLDAAAGVTISPADRTGNSYCASGNTCTFHYTDPTAVTLTGSSGSCAQFTQFTGACTDNPCTLTPATMSTRISASYTGTGC